MTEDEILAKAISLASRAHAGQSDKGGKPYILHPLAVMTMLEPHGLETMAVGVLHDVLEDCPDFHRELVEGFPSEIVAAVFSVTRRPGEGYFDFIRRAAEHPVGCDVKEADILHNMDLSRLPEELRSWGESMNRKRYEPALEILAKAQVRRQRERLEAIG